MTINGGKWERPIGHGGWRSLDALFFNYLRAIRQFHAGQ
jgi:hypothetical protein